MLQEQLFPPKSQWTPPLEYPSLTTATLLSLDLETKDPHLRTRGPGWATGDGEIVGIAVADGKNSWYFPIKHFGGGNLDHAMTLRWLKDTLTAFKGTLILANAQYDLGWLHRVGIRPTCEIADIQIIEPLLDEERRSYSLDSLAESYLGVGKQERKLREAARVYGVDPKAEMWKLHSRFVGAYAEWDARATYDVYLKQLPRLKEENLEEIYRLEQRVQPTLLAMAATGVRVDVEAAIRLDEEWLKIENDLLRKLGIKHEDLWTTGFLISMFKKKGLTHPMTEPTKTHENGQPSFPKEFIRSHPDPDVQHVGNLRELSRLRSIYVHKRIVMDNINGRVYPHYRQLTSDEGGTVTGRLSCRYHNKQQIPKRSDFVDATRIRSLYLPEEGELWLGADYDSQEPRLQVHYGLKLELRGATEAAEYISNGKKLYHLIQDSAGCSYSQAKTVYLGLAYGMGLKSLASNLGVSEEEAESNILNPLMERSPFLKQIAQRAAARANKKGYIVTLAGRKRHFNWWQSVYHWDHKHDMEARYREGKMDSLYWWLKRASEPFATLEEAETFFDGKPDTFQRAFTNKAGNALIQGGAADQTKMALANVFDETGKIPISQVHDELNFSVSNEAEMNQIKEIMENAIPLLIPSVADCELGQHW